jgi:hypothetical protein
MVGVGGEVDLASACQCVEEIVVLCWVLGLVLRFLGLGIGGGFGAEEERKRGGFE